ncbi:unnamed protein product [marine sediment metagenome]|uniref:Uncharacterized protein n=1 Tax=marine sediment metagenome TaxID=412755 RepID=X0YMG6_9ZZZZ
MKNEALQTLHSNLVRSVYALDGIDGEFVANLCRRIPFKPRSSDWPESAVLSRIPANQVAGLLAEIEWTENAVQDCVNDALDPDSGSNPEWDITVEEANEPTGNVEHCWRLMADLADYRAKLGVA